MSLPDSLSLHWVAAIGGLAALAAAGLAALAVIWATARLVDITAAWWAGRRPSYDPGPAVEWADLTAEQEAAFADIAGRLGGAV